MLHYFRLIGLALLLSVGVGSVGKAASFDCNKATTETEITICSDPELSALDELMGQLWKDLDPSDILVAEQKAWLKQRDEPQPEGSSETNPEYLYYKYLPRIAILMGQLNQRDVINIFENNDYWQVDHTTSKTAFTFNRQDFQFLFVPSQNNINAVFADWEYFGGTQSCERREYYFSNENLLFKENCNSMFYYDEIYSYSDGYFFLSKATESFGRRRTYDGNILSTSTNYETGVISVEERAVCTLFYDPFDCFLESTEFTHYSFNNQKRFQLGNFSRQELPQKGQPVNSEKGKDKLKHVDYFKRFSPDNYKFKDDYSSPNLTDAVTSLISNMSTQPGSHLCGNVLSGYSKVMSGYTAVFSSFSDLRNSFLNDDPIEFTLNRYRRYWSSEYLDYSNMVSLSEVLAFLDSYSATENIISFWFNKLDEDTKTQLSHFAKYAVEYRKETGALLNACFGDFEKNEFYVVSVYKQKTGKESKFLWKPINGYLDGFWERRNTDGTADQVQSIFQLISD